MSAFENRVVATFDTAASPPALSARDGDLYEHYEAGPLFHALTGRSWVDVVRAGGVFSIEEDPLVWTGYLPPEWFLYYLPAMLIGASEGNSISASNLKGLLASMLKPALRGDLEGEGEVARYVVSHLTDDQLRLVRDALYDRG